MANELSKRRKWFSGAAAAALATFAGVSVAHAQGTWTPLAAVQPAATEGMTVGGVGQVIIGAYGFSPFTGDTQLTRLYNISTNSWSLGATAPSPVRSEEAYGDTTHGGFFYVIGGRSGGGVINNLERYDPVTNTWTTLAAMPTARAGTAAAVVDDAIFVIGGRLSPGGPCSGGPFLDVVERYDIEANTWSTVASLPSARSDLAAVAHGGKIFVFGGCSAFFSGFLNEVDMYDPETNTWTTGLAPMPTARASFVAGIKGDKVFAIGGWAGGGPLSVNEVYNIPRNSWSTAADIPTPRGEAGVYSHGGRIFVVGGSQPAFGASTDANEVFKPSP